MKKLLLLLLFLWGVGVYGIWYWTDPRTQRVSYRTVIIKRGDIGSTINTTGTIEPEEVVDVGAQVAGRIESFASDPGDPRKTISYGSRVEQGTVLARLEGALFQARLDQARGRVAKAEADIEQAQAKLRQVDRELERCRKLKARGTAVIAQKEFDEALANYESAKAALAVTQGALAVARADLEEATVNLGYTTIRSPVKGIILDRRINIGQTVVASLNAPSLFLIAKDLSRLEIWSSVNETDIGSIHVGQKVHFTVSALPRDTFEGKVAQIRLNASMTQNVVTYTVVIAVDNSSGRLLPYLTARIQFEVEARKGVLVVPNAALRWQPHVQHIVHEARDDYALLVRRRAQAQGESARTATSSQDEPVGLLWIRQGNLVRPIKIRIGLSDGFVTEVSGDGLAEGTEIVVGANRVESDPDALSILPHTWSEPPKK
ncbi:MAG TPA: efflux RND transporter periplasmic adaptor subunit [Acidimicrobiales bacterium]|nr:efflux RND transporter periplasmic adaptor subunit [Acidimicrobiales bacterium]